MKKSKKIALPLLLTLGAVAIPILIGSALITNSNTTSNKTTSLISDRKIVRAQPRIGADGIITPEFVTKLIAGKKGLPDGWDNTLIASDFEGATSVAVNAFFGNTEIISIILPTTVIKIGSRSFSNLTALKSISGIDNVLNIGDHAFSGSTLLTTISALAAINIGYLAFNRLGNIDEGGIKLTFSANIKLINAKQWGTKPNKLEIIGTPTLPTIINGIITPEFVTKLIIYKTSLFETGDGWDGALIASDFEGATSVAAAAFQNNTKITSIYLSTEVTIIGTNAFNNASFLTIISALGATSIGKDAFLSLSRIENYGIKLIYSTNIKPGNANNWGTTPIKLSIIGAPALPEIKEGIITPEFVTKLISYKKSLLATDVVWNGVLAANDFIGATSVAAAAFQNNTEITSIILPTEVTKIGVSSFSNVAALKSISGLDNVLSIGANAFNGASALTTISLLSATNIGTGAFTGTTSIIDGGIKLTYSTNIKLGNAEIWGINLSKLDISGGPTLPTITNGIIDLKFVTDLIAYKKELGSWDTTLIASDFINATSVAAAAFQNNNEITSIILPTEVTKIGVSSFSKAALKSISGLDNVLSIGANAFNGASALTTISLLSATSIGDGAFAGTTSTINLTWSADVNNTKATDWGTTIDKLLFIDAPTLPSIIDGIITPTFVNDLITYKEKIASQTDTNWNGVLADNDFIDATSVADSAFQNKANIISIILPTEVKKIGPNAFNGASALKTISLLGATSIGDGAFAEMTGIIANGIKLTYSTNIKPSNFDIWGTTRDKLDIAGILPTKPTITNGIIDKVYVEKLIAYKNYLLATDVVWNGVLAANDFIDATSVDDAAFENNTEITSIILPTKVTKIGVSSFSNVTALKSISGLDNVLSIGANAFNGASALTTISLLSATSIGDGAFAGTTSITNGGIKLTGSENITIDQSARWGTDAANLDIKIIVGFFDNPIIIYIIAGASGGLLLIIALVTGILIYRKKANAVVNVKNKTKDKDSKKDKTKDDSKTKSVDTKEIDETKKVDDTKSVDTKEIDETIETKKVDDTKSVDTKEIDETIETKKVDDTKSVDTNEIDDIEELINEIDESIIELETPDE